MTTPIFKNMRIRSWCRSHQANPRTRDPGWICREVAECVGKTPGQECVFARDQCGCGFLPQGRFFKLGSGLLDIPSYLDSMIASRSGVGRVGVRLSGFLNREGSNPQSPLCGVRGVAMDKRRHTTDNGDHRYFANLTLNKCAGVLKEFRFGERE